MDDQPSDHMYMQRAIDLVRGVIGTTAPNPAVGCVIVKDNTIIAEGVTQKNGRPHAETVALKKAGKKAQGATLYVTLEPCCHTGKTPPCTQAIIQAGISRVVIATKDPYPLVNGKGIETLEAAGIAVSYGVEEHAATDMNRGFFSVQRKGRPWITVKVAMSLDSKIATASGESQWITGQGARDYVHLLRSQHDAVLTGIGTVLADDPLLTCRTPETESRKPIRVILDTHLRIPLHSRLIQTARDVFCWIYTHAPHAPRGDARIFTCPITTEGQLDLHSMVQDLATRGITQLLVEAGGQVVASFLESELVDELIIIRAPILIGHDGVQAFQMQGLQKLADAPRFVLHHSTTIHGDSIEIYRTNTSLLYTSNPL